EDAAADRDGRGAVHHLDAGFDERLEATHAEVGARDEVQAEIRVAVSGLRVGVEHAKAGAEIGREGGRVAAADVVEAVHVKLPEAEAGRVEVELDRGIEGDREGRHAVTELAADEPVFVVQVVAHVRTQPDLRGGVGGGGGQESTKNKRKNSCLFHRIRKPRWFVCSWNRCCLCRAYGSRTETILMPLRRGMQWDSVTLW